MPGQIAHFYLASRMAEKFQGKGGIREELYKGFAKWLNSNKKFEADTQTAVDDDDADKMQATVNDYRDTLLASDTVALFSAFTAGAVGPDLWTVPVEDTATLISKGGPRGSWYFDMGHYNLSHIFPKYTLSKIRGLPQSLQKDYQTAYILGFISHIALDILAHLQVNVFAGAYHKQQPERWETEQGNIKEKLNKLNNHNKIEHYLDAFIRFFCFEGFYTDGADTGTYKRFRTIVKNDFGQNNPWRFPNYTSHYSKIMKFGRVIKTNGIKNYPDACFLDLTTSLPGPFAHRYHVGGAKGVKPFIRDYFAKAYEGVVEDWLKSGYSSLSELESEVTKLEYFNFIDDLGWRDINDEITTQYYYIHTAIPNLDKVVKHTEKFYSPEAFGHFIQGAMKVAEYFIGNAIDYLRTGNESSLDCLNHWNLDTGQAIRIKKGKWAYGHPIPARLDIECVLDLPCLSGWKIPSLQEIKHQGKKMFTFPKREVASSCEIGKAVALSSGKKHICVHGGQVGIEIIVRQVCFYSGDQDDEIGASILGSTENENRPWVIQGSDHAGQRGYDMGLCFEDFRGDYSSAENGKACGRKSKRYKSVFSGRWAESHVSTEKKDAVFTNESRILPRHIKISTYRKFVNYATDTGNFSADKVGTYISAYPSEEMVFSVFVLEKDGDSFKDVFCKGVEFTKSQVDSLKKIHVIGVNVILLILKKGEKGANSALDEAWIDGEKAKVT